MLGYYAHRVLSAESTRVDDAYMFLRYANNILADGAYAWNPNGPQTYGCTSIPHAYFVAGSRLLFPDSADGRLLTLGSGLVGGLALLVLALAGALHARSELWRRPSSVAVFVFPWLVFNESFLYHATSGMDTMLSLLANGALLCALAALARAQTVGRAVWLALAAYATFLTRPDNGLYMILVPALYLGLVLRSERRIIGSFFVALFALLAVDAGVKWLTFGNPLPLSYYVKRTGFYDGYAGAHKWNPVGYVVDFCLAAWPFWAAALLTMRRRDGRYLVVFALPLVATFAYYFGVVQIVGAFYRFYLPSMAFLVVLAIVLLDRFWLGKRPRALGKPLLIRCGVAVACIGVLFFGRGALASTYERAFLDNPSVEGYRLRFPETDDLPRLGWWRSIEVMTTLAGRLPPETTIAASEHGRLGAAHPALRIVDLTGLHNPAMAHQGFSMETVVAESPALIWFPHDDYVKIRFDIYRDAVFRRDYVFLPSGLDYGIAVRRDREDIYRLVSRVFGRVYEVRSLKEYAR